MNIDRRQLLAGMGAFGFAAVASNPAFATRLQKNPFTLGVASGDPWPDGFVLWTRLAPSPLEAGSGMPGAIFDVAWEVSADEHFRIIVRRGTSAARPDMGHSVHVELAGLEPSRRYWYRFHSNGHESPIGTVRTAPVALGPVDQLKIGVAGCQNYEHGYYTAYKYMADQQLDAVFHYGDYIYEGPQGKRYDVPVIREHVGPEITTLDDYRRRYALYKLDPDLQAAHASAAFMVTFDDHEIENNWAGQFDENGSDPAEFLIRRRAAMQAWYENLPVRKAQRPTATGVQMYRRLDYGQLVRVHLLDTRQYRDDQICSPKDTKACRDRALFDKGLLLGERQHQWLSDGLSSQHQWNLIGQQVVVMPHDRQLQGSELPETGEDSWLGYPESRRRLVKAIQDKKLSNVIIATGDVHQNIVGYVPARDDAPDRDQVATEFVCTSISSLGDGRDIKIRGQDYRALIARNPNVLFANGQRGYHVFNIGPKEWRTDIMKVDKISDRSGTLSRLASFTVENGSPLAIQG